MPNNTPTISKTVAAVIKSYSLVILSVALSTLARVSLNPFFGKRVAFITYFPALVFSAWVGGWGGGIVALALSTLAATYYFISPTHALFIAGRTDQVSLLVFVIVGLSVSAISSSQRKAQRLAAQTAEDLRESEARKSAVLEVALDCIITIDEAGRIVEFNPAAEKTFGYTAQEARGRTVAETIIPPSLRQGHVDGLARYLKTGVGPVIGKRIEVSGLRRGGEEFPVELAIVPMQADGTSGFTAYLRDITARKALEEEQARLSDTNRLLLDSTEEGIYGIDLQGNLTFVNRAAAHILGYSQESLIGRNGHVLIHHTRPDGSPYPAYECPIYKAMREGETARVEDDVFWRASGVAFPVSYSAAPIIAQGIVRGAVVTFSDISARKELEHEQALLAEREHRIAEQLQQALQPRLPEEVPGLELADYYRAALGEAEVGGDFSDVFATDKGVTYLAVGDLSGKGLAAASQVATVRNMLRYAVFHERTLAEAVTNLNMALAEQGLLTGFATLFVGYYDAASRVLTYVNCGQDDGLILRAGTGEIVPLPTTGTVLGAVGGAEFTEETVMLRTGDVLAVFTDGLTEAGPTRRSLLMGEGVAALLREQRGLRTAQEIKTGLMASVDAYAQGGVRDDQCLLVGVVL